MKNTLSKLQDQQAIFDTQSALLPDMAESSPEKLKNHCWVSSWILSVTGSQE